MCIRTYYNYLILFVCIHTAPQDYTALENVPIQFPEMMCISISIENDTDISEGIEDFTVLLSSFDSAVIPNPSETRVLIVDRTPISLEFSMYSVAENAGTLEICVVANGFLEQDVDVFLLTADVTASLGKIIMADICQSTCTCTFKSTM